MGVRETFEAAATAIDYISPSYWAGKAYEAGLPDTSVKMLPVFTQPKDDMISCAMKKIQDPNNSCNTKDISIDVAIDASKETARRLIDTNATLNLILGPSDLVSSYVEIAQKRIDHMNLTTFLADKNVIGFESATKEINGQNYTVLIDASGVLTEEDPVVYTSDDFSKAPVCLPTGSYDDRQTCEQKSAFLNSVISNSIDEIHEYEKSGHGYEDYLNCMIDHGIEDMMRSDINNVLRQAIKDLEDRLSSEEKTPPSGHNLEFAPQDTLPIGGAKPYK